MTNTTTNNSMWGDPYIVHTIILTDTIEVVWRQDPQFSYTSFPPQSPNPKVWKEIYSVVKIGTVEGQYRSPREESYDF